jgi:DNA-binding MarR family transcriptional regulator
MTAKIRLLHWSDEDRARFDRMIVDLADGSAPDRSQLTKATPRTLDAVEVAQTIFEKRRARSKTFGRHAAMFQEPAWDILLELFIHHRTRRTLAVSGIAFSIGASLSTSLRWIRRLKEHGLVERIDDAADARLHLVGLSATGLELMRTYLESV